MEVLGFILQAIVFLVTAAIGLIAVVMAGAVLWLGWPSIAAVFAGMWLWTHGHDSWGVVTVVGGLVFNLAWWGMLGNLGSNSNHEPRVNWSMQRFESGKRKLYDADGNVTGYVDGD